MPSFHLTSNPVDRLNLIYSSYAEASWDQTAKRVFSWKFNEAACGGESGGEDARGSVCSAAAQSTRRCTWGMSSELESCSKGRNVLGVCVFVLLSSFTDVIVWFWFGVKSETVKILKNTQRSWSSAFQLGPLQFIVVDHGFILGCRTQWVAKRLAGNAQNDISWTGIVTDLESLVYWI